MESSGDDTDVESQPISEEDIHRLLLIVPDNEASCSAILELRNKLSVQPADETIDHHRSFLRLSSDSYTRGGARDYTPTSGSGSDDEIVILGPEETWEADGHFELNLLYQPARRGAGWTIGRGRTESSAPLVDLLVPLPKSSGMHSYHCAFQFNDAGQLQLMAFHSRVSLDHVPVDAGTARILHRPEHRLQVGPCLYKLTFAPLDHLRDAHQKAKTNYLQEHYPGYGVPHELISATPSRDDQYINDDWKVASGNAVGTGAGDRDTGATFVQAASHTREHKVRALKERRRIDERGARAIQFTERTYARVRRLLNGDANQEFIEHLDEILYSGGSDRTWTPGVKDKVYHLFSPLGNCNFRQAFVRRSIGEVPNLDKTALFVQVLMGLASLHKARIIHRDLKPENLVLVLSNPPKAAIIDFGQAIFLDDEKRGGVMPTPGRGGTIGYLAPEQENAAFSSGGLFGCAIDVFALGLVGIDIFSDPNRPIWPMRSRNPNPFREPLNRAHVAEFDGVLRYLRIHAPGSFFHLLSRMLDKNPATRLTAAEILVHPSVRDYVQAEFVRRESEESSSQRPGSKRMLSVEFTASRFQTPTPGPS